VDSSYLPMIFELNSSGDLFAISYMKPGYALIRSTDNGNSWTMIDNDYLASEPVYVRIAANDEIFMGTFDGIYSSTNNGNNFIKRTNGMIKGILSFCTNSSNHLFAGTDGIGVFRSQNNGLDWTYINNGLAPSSENKRIVALCRNSNDYIFAAKGGVYKTQDNGDVWVSCGESSLSGEVNSLIINSHDVIFAGTDEGVFISTDEGENWIEKRNGITDNTPVHCFSINSNGDVFASTFERVYRSLNNGDSWIQIHDNPFDCLTINSNDEIYGATNFDGIHHSTDNGDSWTKISDIPAISMTVNSLDHLFAGNETNGIYYSTDFGETWSQLNSGLANTSILSLNMDLEDYVYAGTAGGLFRSILKTTSNEEDKLEIPKSFFLAQNHPNPFNPTTSIKFQIPANINRLKKNVSLNVYDILGREVITLINENKEAGFHEVEWNASNYPSGVYFYKLSAGDFVETKKMLLLK